MKRHEMKRIKAEVAQVGIMMDQIADWLAVQHRKPVSMHTIGLIGTAVHFKDALHYYRTKLESELKGNK